MAIIQSGATSTLWTIDPTSTAGRITIYDQYGNAMSDVNSLSNILNALNSNVTIILGGQATIGIDVESTSGTLTLSFEATINNSNWFALTMTPATGGATVTTTTANGQWVGSVSGYYAVRARISSFTSGSMTVSAVVTPGQSKTGAQSITTAGALSVEITDGSSDGPAAVKNASTPATVTDPALVVAVSPNNSIAITAASLPLPTGAATSANLTTLGAQTTEINDGTRTATIKAASTAALAGDTAIVVAVSPNNTPVLPSGAATSANQTNGTQETQIVQGGNIATVTAASALKVDGSAITQPVSGTVATTQSGTWTVQPGNTANTTPWLATINQGSNSATVTASNALKVDGSAVTQPISAASLPLPTGAATSANLTTLGAQTTEINDGTHTAAIKAASTAAIATDPSFVVALSPNSPLPNIGSIDAGNSSTATLGSGSVFTGTGISGLGYASILVTVIAIGSSAPPGTLSIQQSMDNSNWDIQDNYTITGGTASPTGEFDVGVNLKAAFYRVVYTNGATTQTAFRLQTIAKPVYFPIGNSATQRGTQGQTFVPVQQPKDSGRTAYILAASAATPATTDTMVTLTPLTAFVAGATGTTFTIPSGKIFRIQQFNAAVRAITTTAISAANFRLRISNTGAVTTATIQSASILLPATAAIANAGTNNSINFPDGLEISGTMQIGVSALSSSTSSSVDIQIIGYLY